MRIASHSQKQNFQKLSRNFQSYGRFFKNIIKFSWNYLENNFSSSKPSFNAFFSDLRAQQTNNLLKGPNNNITNS